MIHAVKSSILLADIDHVLSGTEKFESEFFIFYF
jgi:hypothetical protein